MWRCSPGGRRRPRPHPLRRPSRFLSCRRRAFPGSRPSERGAGTARLVGGRAAGALPGSAWGIYPPGESQFAPGQALASATVTRLDGDDALADFSPGDVALPSGARATLVAPPPAADELAVLLALGDGKREKQLREQIAAQLPVVDFVADDEFARFRVEQEGSEYVVLAADGVSEIARLDGAGTAAGVTRLVALFARSMTASELLALDNPATTMTLDLAVGSAERADAAAASPMRGMVIAETSAAVYRIRKPGDPRTASNSLQLSVTPSADCYLTVVDVDSEGNILLLFPNPISESRGYYPSGKIEANSTIRIPDSLEPGNRAGFHIDYAPPVGTDTVRAFCSVDESIAQALRDAIGSFGNGSPAASRGAVRAALTGDVRDTLTLAMTRGLKLVADTPEPEPAPAPAPPSSPPVAPAAAAPEKVVLPDWVAASLTLEIHE